ncbi:MAG: TonB-dependent receptor [bacterium]|nr:TonB-dependent receptor [bacterium]
MRSMGIVLVLLLAALCVLRVIAGEAQRESAGAGTGSAEESAEDEAELRRLLEILEKHTEIATKTKLNADFVPGMVTVLYGDDLEARGARTVREALALVPGIEASAERGGSKVLIVRGLPRTFLSGTIKILCNGVPMNAGLQAGAPPVLELPVELVERIEVIRGPGSAIHGEFAYVGVINVITRREADRIFVHGGSFASYGGGALVSWSAPGKDLRMSLNLAARESDGADVRSGSDVLHDLGMPELSNAPGPANEDEDAQSGILTLDYRGFSLQAQMLTSGEGERFGFDALPPPEDRIVYRYRHRVVDAHQALALSPALRLDLRLTGWQNLLDVDRRYGSFFGGPDFESDRMSASSHYHERRIHGGVELSWKGWERQLLLLGWSVDRTTIGDAWQDTPEAQHSSGPEPFLLEGRGRLLHSVTVQDEIRIRETFTVTAGLRYDDYDDVGISVTPRLAAVWRLRKRHILKAQYARAFRPPSFLEMYVRSNPLFGGDPEIEPAIIDTFELGYVYRQPRTVGRVTLYDAELDDLIVLSGGRYTNSEGGWLRGVELELERELASSLKLDANLSYADNEQLDTGERMPGTASWLGNLRLLWQPRASAALNLDARYVGRRSRDPRDPREDLDGYHAVDLTASVLRLRGKGWTLRGGVQNLFDEDVRYPAPRDTFPEDYPQPGRRWWMQLAYEF